jgi:hypothetical protein
MANRGFKSRLPASRGPVHAVESDKSERLVIDPRACWAACCCKQRIVWCFGLTIVGHVTPGPRPRAARNAAYGSSMADVLEVPIDNWIAAFNGRVLEIFTPYKEGSVRYHARLTKRCWIDGNVLTLDLERNDRSFWPFNDDQRS